MISSTAMHGFVDLSRHQYTGIYGRNVLQQANRQRNLQTANHADNWPNYWMNDIGGIFWLLCRRWPCLGGSTWQGFLNHALMPHITILPPPIGPAGIRHTPLDALVDGIWCNFANILVLYIPFHFQFDMQCAGNANSNISVQVNASFENILFPWHNFTNN